MMLIGIDPHKSTHTATAIAPDTNHEAASIRIDATLREYRRMLTWARRWPQRRWAVENAEGLGRRGHRYYKSKIAEGKTPREAPRCLKRRLATTSGGP
jgi:transposase